MEINKMIEALEKKGYEIKPPTLKKRVEFRKSYPTLQQDGRYWYINSNNYVGYTYIENDVIDYQRLKMGNVFVTEEKAKSKTTLNELTYKYLELIRQTNQDVGKTVDWEEMRQGRIKFNWNHQTNNGLNYEDVAESQDASSEWYWLIDGYKAEKIIKNHFTDNEIKSILTQDCRFL